MCIISVFFFISVVEFDSCESFCVRLVYHLHFSQDFRNRGLRKPEVLSPDYSVYLSKHDLFKQEVVLPDFVQFAF